MTSSTHRPGFGRRASTSIVALAVASIVFTLQNGPTAQSSAERWVGTWSTAEVGRPQTPPAPPATPGPPPFMANQCPPNPAAAAPGASGFLHFSNQTLRQIVHTSIGGSRVRVVLSNRYGTAPLAIGAAHVALRDKDASIRSGSGRALTFSGRPTFTIPPGAVAYSDPVNLTVPQTGDLAVDLFLPGDTNSPAPLTMHNGAFQTSYVSAAGNHAGTAAFPTATTTQNWFVLNRVEVTAPAPVGGLVAFGDSITDGTRSTPNTNNRWPDHLVRRMLAQPTPLRMGLMNAGIAGNRVLSNAAYQSGINALARFEPTSRRSPASRTSSSSKGSTTSARRGRIPHPPPTTSSPATSRSSSWRTRGD